LLGSQPSLVQSACVSTGMLLQSSSLESV
jgi:hypothetical protein